MQSWSHHQVFFHSSLCSTKIFSLLFAVAYILAEGDTNFIYGFICICVYMVDSGWLGKWVKCSFHHQAHIVKVDSLHIHIVRTYIYNIYIYIYIQMLLTSSMFNVRKSSLKIYIRSVCACVRELPSCHCCFMHRQSTGSIFARWSDGIVFNIYTYTS